MTLNFEFLSYSHLEPRPVFEDPNSLNQVILFVSIGIEFDVMQLI